MADIKIEAQEQPIAPTAKNEWTEAENVLKDAEPKEWDATMELALLNAIARCKPVGMHKHFRIMSVRRLFNQQSQVPCTIKQIWDRLGDYYGMEALDELEEEDEEEEDDDKRQEVLNEFSLPLDDYEQLISEHRQDDQSGYEEPSSPPAKRTRTSKREESPAASVAESAASTPEPEEGKKRSSRGVRKSEVTPEPIGKRSGRRTARGTSRSTTRTKRK
ncbi:chromatin modification-related protein EAF7-domain-containing protein [Phycomyces nitens]|nr:chromatin modification-related protein EAF7-domain-containing protein [Phycomyces nitens]